MSERKREKKTVILVLVARPLCLHSDSSTPQRSTSEKNVREKALPVKHAIVCRFPQYFFNEPHAVCGIYRIEFRL